MIDSFSIVATALAYILFLAAIGEATYQIIKFFLFRDKRKDMRYDDWRAALIPSMVGIFLVWLFYPFTLFSFLPFWPRYVLADIVLSGLTISRGANGVHEGLKVWKRYTGQAQENDPVIKKENGKG